MLLKLSHSSLEDWWRSSDSVKNTSYGTSGNSLGFKDGDIYFFFSRCSELKKKKRFLHILSMLLLEFLYGHADSLDNTPSFPQALQSISSVLCLRTQKSAAEDLGGAFQATHQAIRLQNSPD